MKTYSEWCKHYNYDPKAEQSKEDYLQYKMEYKALTAYAECNESINVIGGSPERGTEYWIKSDDPERGYWRPYGKGYTHDTKEAGRWTLQELADSDFHLSYQTLIAARP